MVFKAIKAGAAALLVLVFCSTAYGESTCVQCHTDEDMLLKNLSQAKEKKSAKQSGSG